MAIPEFKEDLNIISGLNDYPGAEDGLSTAQFKAKFDEAALKIQKYINDGLVPELNKIVDVDALINAIIDDTLKISGKAADAKVTGDALQETRERFNESLESKLSKAGDSMTGRLDMGGNAIENVASPEADNDAANKKFVEDIASERLSLELLWENASPSSEFAATTSPISLGDSVTKYSHFMVEFSSDDSCIVRKGGTLYLPRITITSSDDEKTGYVNWYQRSVNISNNGASFGNCFRMAGSTGNGITTKREITTSYLKPYRVWGIGGMN